jgi:hypothetical protein
MQAVVTVFEEATCILGRDRAERPMRRLEEPFEGPRTRLPQESPFTFEKASSMGLKSGE